VNIFLCREEAIAHNASLNPPCWSSPTFVSCQVPVFCSVLVLSYNLPRPGDNEITLQLETSINAMLLRYIH